MKSDNMTRAPRSRALLALPLALVLGVLLCGRSTAPGQPPAAKNATAFRQARPILIEKCLACHGPERQRGGLNLNQRATALAGGDSGPALVPGKPLDSLIYQKVAAGKMPPDNPLSPAQVAALKAWIEAGAPYPVAELVAGKKRGGPWWSLQPVRRTPPPSSPHDGLALNPIDRFVFARLAAEGLRPSPPADRLALLRRVTIDLTGLPPTPAEVDAFLADRSPDAYEKVVDRLLTAPAHGERWARHWLDVVRFGESHGYEQNHLRPNAWPYRDYVIRAFNEDRPFDRFVAEQLAGDVLAAGAADVEAATGFLVAGVHDTVGIQTEEGTRQQRATDLDDIVSTVGGAFLGLTAGCARCHDHKFDPIPQKDYYRLAAVFAGVRHAERPLSSGGQAGGAAEAARRLRVVRVQLADLLAEGRAAVLKARGVASVMRPPLNVRRNVEDFAAVKARFVRLTILATQDGAEPCIDELEVYGSDRARNLALASAGARASASSLLPGYAIHQVGHLNDGKYGNSWSWISRERGRGWAQIELSASAEVSRVVWARDAEGEQPRFSDRLASRYRVEVSLDGESWRTVATDADREKGMDPGVGDKALRDALTPAQRRRHADLLAERARLVQVATPPTPTSAYIGRFTRPDPIFLLKRGDVMQRGEAATPAGLSGVPKLSGELDIDAKLGEPGRRLALARWITSPGNPLTARVLVNRLWQHHFGEGIVGTPSDFGRAGVEPSHPELLDWLAAEFMEGGWRLKRLHRLLVTSATYRQSSAATAAGLKRDAGNRLLWRMPLRRLEAEAVRDAILAVSGKLDRGMGGPGFRLFKYRVVNVAIYEPLDEHGPETWRRAVYRQSARAIRENLLANFDCPECAQQAPRREVTTTPLQALSLLNGPFTLQQAGFFAARLEREAGADAAAQVERAFRLAFGRSPSDRERGAAVALVRGRGLAALCRVLLNANEFLYY